MVRTAEKVMAGYEKSWESVLKQIQSLVEGGERDLSRILYLLYRNQITENVSSLEEDLANFLSIRRDGENRPLFRVVACDGKYVAVPRYLEDNLIVEIVLGYVTEDIDMIVELGSGWGRNLFSIFARSKLNNIHYVACELTEAGRRATRALQDVAHGMQMTIRPFDFHNPDFSFLESNPNVLFFSNHAIEQCTYLGHALFDCMLEKTNTCTGIHMEPIGWQNHPQASSIREMIKEGLIPNDTFRIDDNAFTKNSMIWAARHEYNMNFLELLRHYHESGNIEVEILYDYFGRNPFNPGSLVVWRKTAR